MEQTTNLNLSKPSYDDVADIVVLDQNFQILDDQFDGDKIVKSVNNIKPVNHNVTLDLGVTSVNGQTGAVTITERSVMQIIDIVYPVGSFYDTTDTAFNPNVSWGGTWEKITNGTVLIAGGGSYNIGQTYGEASHKLTINELPSHNHSASVSTAGNHAHTRGSMNITGKFSADQMGAYHNQNARGEGAFYLTGEAWYSGSEDREDYAPVFAFDASRSWTGETSYNGNHSHIVTIGNTGNNISFNLIQPSLAVARWHRTA